MATKKQIDEYYSSIYGKPFPGSTLSKWVKEGKIKATQNNGRYDYDLESFVELVSSETYLKQLRAKKEKPEEYIGKTKGQLLILGIVPKEEYQTNYSGTLMYCDCLACGNKKIQVRFTYLSDNGNYDQLSCGCGRKRRAFLASAREDIEEQFLLEFDDFEKFLFIHKMLSHITDNYYGTHCPVEKYKEAVKQLYNDIQFNKVYNFWRTNEMRGKTFYDLAKPSLDHIVPLSRGGNSKIENLQVLTVFENLAKRDMTQEEWYKFKQDTNTTSDYFIEKIMKKEVGDECNED